MGTRTRLRLRDCVNLEGPGRGFRVPTTTMVNRGLIGRSVMTQTKTRQAPEMAPTVLCGGSGQYSLALGLVSLGAGAALGALPGPLVMYAPMLRSDFS